ncbi:Transcriptional regulator [Halogranum amylolyticum]|uniref:Transcriptional regulator n=1 Tax=Halogranum amylolyticum TaxID=660520 RepID=A0A1H8WG97_9EURY|nr:Rrf2 family transcriptional regulator [Halogranum amylolyticum]SEP26695.1 Transcriptional regulator [Halogranum amylolyticum]
MGADSIDIRRFEEADSDEFASKTDTVKIVEFLATHSDHAWKAKVIAERADVNPDSVSTLLSRLKDRGLVRHKEPYWAITDDRDRLSSAYRLHTATKRLDERYGEEDPDDWTTEASQELE